MRQTRSNARGSWCAMVARIAGLTAAVGALGACANPFATTDKDLGMRIEPRRLRTVDTLDISASRTAASTDGRTESEKLKDPPPDPFAGLDQVDVTLEQARAWALEGNLDLRVALIQPTIAAERVNEEEAKFEGLFTLDGRYGSFDQPTDSTLSGSQFQTLDLTPQVSVPLRTGGTIALSMPISRQETDNQFSTLNPSYQSDVRFSISQPLLRNAGRETTTYSIRIAALQDQISQAEAKLSVIRELANVDRTYWRLYAFRALLDVRVSQWQLALDQLERAERRVRAGDAAEVEVVRAQSGLAQRLVDIITAQNSVRTSQRELKRVMNAPGLDVGSDIVLMPATPPNPVSYTLDAPMLADAGVANRMEMLQLELQIAQDASTISFAKNQALPNFVLDYSYSINGLGGNISQSLNQTRDNNFNDWTVGGTLQVPLGNEAAESRVHQAILQRLQKLASKSAQELSIRQEVYNGVDGLDDAWQAILAARQSTLLAARTLSAEENQFKVGQRTSTDVLNAATQLADAQAAEIRAITEYQIAQVDLAFATGTLLGAAKVDWDPVDPRTPDTYFGDKMGKTAREWRAEKERVGDGGARVEGEGAPAPPDPHGPEPDPNPEIPGIGNGTTTGG